jgi:hypothetical protein
VSSHSAHNTITLALTGALAALAFSAATAQASPDAPTPIGDGFNVTDCCVIGPWQALEDQYYQDFSVPNDPANTFEGLVREDSPFFGFSGIRSDYNVYVEKDIAGNVPVGEQYNSLNFDTEGFNLVYNTIGGTPEAAYITPFGDLNFPTWFVEAVGPSLFEPSFYTEPPLSNATTAAAELPAQAFSAATDPPDAPTPIAGTDSPITQSDAPWFEQLQYSQDFRVLNAPDETFEGVVRLDTNDLGLDDHNVSVVQDISGNVPVGEQYNIFTFDDIWGEVYNSIGGTPEAFYTTPFGDIDIPTWFVEAVGPTLFEPGAPWLAGLL